MNTISDVTVQINVLNPQPLVGLGVPAIFVTGTENTHTEYENLESLEKKYGRDTSVYKKAKAVWAQNNRPKIIAVITYKEGGIAQAAESFFLEAWHFALLSDYSAQDALALSNFIEEQEYKFLVVQVATAADLAQFESNSLTICLVHPVEEALDAALIGNTSSLTVGSVTWKGRHDLKGITAQKLSVSQLTDIHAAGGLAYVKKAGIPQMSEGKTAGGEFIDSLHGDHWIKATIETKLQRLISNTDKLTFDSVGIALLKNELTNVFEQAFTNGIIDRDDETGNGNYVVNALQRNDLDPDDIAARNYKGLSFNYKRSGAIHTVDVTGTIEV